MFSSIVRSGSSLRPSGTTEMPDGAHTLGPPVRDVLAVDHHLAGRDPQEAGDRGGERRLAGAVRAEHGRDLTGGDVERHAVDDPATAALDDDVVDLHRTAAHPSALTVSPS